MDNKLTISIALNPGDVLAYEAAMLKELTDLPDIELSFIKHRPQIKNSWNHGNHAYKFYAALDNAILRIGDDPFKSLNLESSADFKNLANPKSSDPKQPENPDFCIIFSSHIDLAEKHKKNSRYGCLYIDCVDANNNSQSPAGYWDVMDFTDNSVITVRLLPPDGEKQTLYQSHSATTEVSPRQNRERMFWKAKSFIPSILKQLTQGSVEKNITKLFEKQKANQALNPLFNSGPNSSNHIPEQQIDWEATEQTTTLMALTAANEHALDDQQVRNAPPTALTLAKHLLFKAPGFFRFYLQNKLYWDQWFLLYNFSATENPSLEKFKPIFPPKDRIWADPHIFVKNEKNYVFIEEMLHKEDKGFISVMEIYEDGYTSIPVKVLEEDFHLSYPQVFEWKNEIWMMPESSQNKTISLYRCKQFPNKWEKHCDLLTDIDAVDTSILFHDNKCWLFCSVRPHPDASENDELHIFYSDDLLNEGLVNDELNNNHWEAHPKNPVVSDVRRARPAGKIYQQFGRLMRPSQNCTKVYGHGFNLNHISLLTEEEYEETPITCVNADQLEGTIGIHTYARENKLTVLDACRRYSKFFVSG